MHTSVLTSAKYNKMVIIKRSNIPEKNQHDIEIRIRIWRNC